MKKIITLLLFLGTLILFAENLTLTLPSDNLISSIDELAKYNPDFGSTTLPGSFKLPAKRVNIVLPPTKEITDISFNISSTTVNSANSPELNTAYSDGEEYFTSNSTVNNNKHYIFKGLHSWGNLNYASFEWLPIIYTDNSYSIALDVSISIDYTPEVEVNRTVLKEVIDEDFFINPEDITNNYYYSRNVNYIVIGDESNRNDLIEFMQFREDQGMNISYEDINQILASGIGSDDVEKLRNYLIGVYEETPFAYLLLIGDLDTIPLPYLSAEPGAYQETASDFYYSDLTSNFDSDNDGILGEFSIDGVIQDGGMDFTPETFVGRIPFTDSNLLGTILDRIISYEDDNGTWKDDSLFPMSYLNYGQENFSEYPISNYAATGKYLEDTVLRDYDVTAMYEEAGVVPSSPQFPSDIPVTYDNFVNEMNSNDYGFINWAGHGSPVSSIRTVWYEDINGNNIPESGSELGGETLVSKDMFEPLTNPTGAVFFCSSCYNGKLDHYELSVGETLIRDKAVANIAATRTSWYKVGWQNPGWGGLQSYNTHFVEYLFANEYSVGKSLGLANFLHTNFYLFGDPIDSGGIIHPELKNVYTHLLFGDPAIRYQPTGPLVDGDILVLDKSLSQRGITLVNALNDVANFNVIFSNKLVPADLDYSRYEAIFALRNGDDTGEILLNWEVDVLNNYYNNGGKMFLEAEYFNQLQVSSDFSITVENEVVNIDPTFTPINGLEGTWDYINEFTSIYPISCDGTALLTQENSSGTINTLFHLEDDEHNVFISNIDIIGFLGGGELSGFTSLLNIMNITQPVDNSHNNALPTTGLELTNYPNPFNPETTISFNANGSNQVEISIYNVRGQLVKTINKENLNDGRNSIVWKGTDKNNNQVSSGIYFYNVKTDRDSETAKMILMK